MLRIQSQHSLEPLNGIVCSICTGQQHAKICQGSDGIWFQQQRRLVFTFSFRRQSALIKDGAEQAVRLRVARVGCDNFSRRCFRFFKPTGLEKFGRFGKFN